MRILLLIIGVFVFATIWWWRGMTGPLPLSALRERYSLAGSTFPVLAGIETHVVDAGEGSAIIMLHGNLNSVWLWNDWAEQLVAGGYRVLRFDLPPYGLSARAPDGRPGVIATYDVLSELMDRSGIERAVIVTTANGGPPAAWYARAHPDRVAGLVFINTPFTTPRGGLTDAASFQRWVRDNFYRYIGKPVWATRSYLAEIVIPARPLPEPFVMHIHDLGRRADMPNPLGVYGSSFAFTSEALNPAKLSNEAMLADLKIPVLIQWGGHALLPPAEAQRLAGFLKGAAVSVKTYADSGHWLPADGRPEALRDIQDFMSSLPGFNTRSSKD